MNIQERHILSQRLPTLDWGSSAPTYLNRSRHAHTHIRAFCSIIPIWWPTDMMRTNSCTHTSLATPTNGVLHTYACTRLHSRCNFYACKVVTYQWNLSGRSRPLQCGILWYLRLSFTLIRSWHLNLKNKKLHLRPVNFKMTLLRVSTNHLWL